MQITKGKRIVAEALGDIPQTGMPVLTEDHPFLRKVIAYMQTKKEWLGTVTDLLHAVGDSYTPPNTVAKLLRKYDYQYLYREKGIDVSFRRTNRKRLIGLNNKFYFRSDGSVYGSGDGFFKEIGVIQDRKLRCSE